MNWARCWPPSEATDLRLRSLTSRLLSVSFRLARPGTVACRTSTARRNRGSAADGMSTLGSDSLTWRRQQKAQRAAWSEALWRHGVSIGDTLAEARRQAGLTVAQVSDRTRIRETIIRGIEQNDFSACGGDFYARGHIRSVASVVGVDPAPLLREYHGAPEAIRAAEVFEPSTPIRIKERRSLNWSVAMILALLVVVGYGIYHFVSAGSGGSSGQTAAGAPPAATRSARPQPTTTHSAAPSPIAANPSDVV